MLNVKRNLLMDRIRVNITGIIPVYSEQVCKNHLNEEITPLHLTGIGERFSRCQIISNLGHEALLRRCELPL